MGRMADDILKIGCAAGAEPIFNFLLFFVSREGGFGSGTVETEALGVASGG